MNIAALIHASELAGGWAGKPSWSILEVDASPGPALFLASWTDWRADPDRSHLLHYVAACTHLQAWSASDTPNQSLEEICSPEICSQLTSKLWGIEPTGWQRISLDNGRVLLTLVAAANPIAALRGGQLTADTIVLRTAIQADAAMCGGLSDDPHWWKALARLSRRGTRVVMAGGPAHALCAASQNAVEAIDVGDVPQLPAVAIAAGFVSIPSPGPTLARFDPSWAPRNGGGNFATLVQPESADHQHCIVIGAGIAGAAVAASLARRGWQVTVLEAAANVASGASSLPAGIFVPVVSADDNALSRLTRAGVRQLIEFASAQLEAGVDWQMSGVLQRLDVDKHTDELPQRGDASTFAGWREPAQDEQLEQAGLNPQSNSAHWHIAAGWMRPARLVSALLAAPGITVRCGSRVAQITQDSRGSCTLIGADGALIAQARLVVIAIGYQSGALLGPAFALQPIAGQVTTGHCRSTGEASLRFPVNGKGNGSFIDGIPLADGKRHWLAGATFERDATGATAGAAHINAARCENLARLAALLPSAAKRLQPEPGQAGGLDDWRGVRGAAIDRLPVVGAVRTGTEYPGLWACTAMGSRGLSLSLLCAELLAAWLHQEALPVPARLASQLAAARFGTSSAAPDKHLYAYSDKRKTNM